MPCVCAPQARQVPPSLTPQRASKAVKLEAGIGEVGGTLSGFMGGLILWSMQKIVGHARRHVEQRGMPTSAKPCDAQDPFESKSAFASFRFGISASLF